VIQRRTSALWFMCTPTVASREPSRMQCIYTARAGYYDVPMSFRIYAAERASLSLGGAIAGVSGWWDASMAIERSRELSRLWGSR
jgi:hypothetical protein